MVDIPFIYVRPLQCLKKTEWFTMSFGHFAKSQRVLAFCVQVWVVGIWPKKNFVFSPPHTTLSCTCEFFMNSPSGLACGHNHFLLNPVSGTLFTDIKLFAIMQYYTALGRFVQLRGFVFEVFKGLCSNFLFKTSLNQRCHRVN